MKFKVGDRVIFAQDGNTRFGTVVDIYDEPTRFPYRVSFGLDTIWAADFELAFAEDGPTSDNTSAGTYQVGGTHYQGKAFQPFDIINEWELDYYEGNVLKYLLRHKYKNGVEDLRKAKHYLEYKIELLERAEGD